MDRQRTPRRNDSQWSGCAHLDGPHELLCCSLDTIGSGKDWLIQQNQKSHTKDRLQNILKQNCLMCVMTAFVLLGKVDWVLCQWASQHMRLTLLKAHGVYSSSFLMEVFCFRPRPFYFFVWNKPRDKNRTCRIILNACFFFFFWHMFFSQKGMWR